MKDYPIDACELSWRLLGRQLRGLEDKPFIQDKVRATLRRFGCPKTSDSPRANWVVDEDMKKRAAEDLRMGLQNYTAP